ncbi:hypothetical protein [Candidatus Nitrosocosmicus sp. T]
MKFNVIVDSFGNIVGAFQSEFIKKEDGKERKSGIFLKPDQKMFEIEVDNQIIKEHPSKLQEQMQKIVDTKFDLRPYLKK